MKQNKKQKQVPPLNETLEDHETPEENPRHEAVVRSLSVQEKCDLIAELSEAVLENPDAAFTSTEIEDNEGNSRKGISKMRQLLTLASHQESTSDQYVAQLATMSLLAIFRDIIPSYRIRLPTKQEMAIKVSKDTKKIWDYERNLIHHYQQYLKLLEKTWERNKGTSDLSMTCMISLCELLKSAYHFNFRSNLITAVVKQMNAVAPVGEACCQAVEHVFANDAQGEIALEAAREVAKLIKNRNFNVWDSVLRTFVRLPLRVHADEAEAAKLASQANAKKRKRDKELATIEAELKESDARVDKIILARCQSDTLQAVILTYFRILKSENLKTSHIEHLLPAALEGLAKFAHLINIDTVMDLLAVLRELLKKMNALPLDAALNCILTAFSTLQGPGKELQIDVKEYILPLYSQIPRLISDTQSAKHTVLVLDCLESAFLKRREYSTIRLAAFWKQLVTVALHTPPHTSLPLLAVSRQLLHRYPSLEQLLENEQDVVTSGTYTPDVDDPEHSNPLATSAWELATLKFHVHPGIAAQAMAVATNQPLSLPKESPRRLREDCSECYIPYERNTKKHPLQPKGKDQRTRFITPRAVVPGELLLN